MDVWVASWVLSNDLSLKILENYGTSRKSLNALALMASPQLATQKPKFDSFARKLPNLCCETFQKNIYLA